MFCVQDIIIIFVVYAVPRLLLISILPADNNSLHDRISSYFSGYKYYYYYILLLCYYCCYNYCYYYRWKKEKKGGKLIKYNTPINNCINANAIGQGCKSKWNEK